MIDVRWSLSSSAPRLRVNAKVAAAKADPDGAMAAGTAFRITSLQGAAGNHQIACAHSRARTSMRVE